MTREQWADLIVCTVLILIMGFVGASLLLGWFTT